ncbi:hypothetical protein LCGC14_0235060 [marine sediment metagenome]|uniref:DNA methylase N-4/N-6 domain-containing protein n=1 Tax=marine sediment metagenome TaxID=412755 RepID=A0A0F9U8V4_9ZZZZ
MVELKETYPEIQSVLDGESKGCIIQGDCLDVMREIPDGCVDAVITDPPYGIPLGAAFVRGGTKLIEDGSGSFNENGSWSWLADPTWLRAGGNIAAFHKRGDGLPSHVLTWHKFYLVKDAPPPTPRPVFVSAVEECSIGRKPGKSRWFGGGYVPNYWHGMTPNQANKSHGHPSEKPLVAVSVLVDALSDSGDIILDPFCGSGTTCVAAKKLGRRYIGIDIEQKYCDIARDRLLGLEGKRLGSQHKHKGFFDV